jgi:hypothetical protein
MTALSSPSLSSRCIPKRRRRRRPKKKIAATTTMIPTITEVIQVSFQLVQVTLRASARTSRRTAPARRAS